MMKRVHSQQQQQQGSVPFSWENFPGESKEPAAATTQRNEEEEDDDDDGVLGQQSAADKADLLPHKTNNHANYKKGHHHSFHPHDALQIPLPPCAFQPPPLTSSSKRALSKKNDDDPFMIAIKECTKSTAAAERGNTSTSKLITRDDHSGKSFGSRKNINSSSLFSSCTQSCNAIDDSIVKLPRNPVSKSLIGRQRLAMKHR